METISQMRELLEGMSADLAKAVKGNKMAAQRVRTASVLFAKIAKVYRKESLAAEKPAPKKKRHA